MTSVRKIQTSVAGLSIALLFGCGGQSSDDGKGTSGNPAAGATATPASGGVAAGGIPASTSRVALGGAPMGSAATIATGGFVSWGGTANFTVGGTVSSTTTIGGRSTGGTPASTTGEASTGGKSSGGTATGGKATGGTATAGIAGQATSTATGGSAGNTNPGTGGAAGAVNCPAIKCASFCMDGTWNGLDGCPTCACAPPSAYFFDDEFKCPSASLSVSATSSYFIGGIDRWDIAFTWSCSAAITGIGVPLRATLQIGIRQTPPTPIDGTNQTFFLPESSSSSTHPYQVSSAIEYIAGSGRPEIDLRITLISNFLSIRREGDRLVGGIEYVGKVDSTAKIVTLAAPFDVPVPTM